MFIRVPVVKFDPHTMINDRYTSVYTITLKVLKISLFFEVPVAYTLVISDIGAHSDWTSYCFKVSCAIL